MKSQAIKTAKETRKSRKGSSKAEIAKRWKAYQGLEAFRRELRTFKGVGN